MSISTVLAGLVIFTLPVMLPAANAEEVDLDLALAGPAATVQNDLGVEAAVAAPSASAPGVSAGSPLPGTVVLPSTPVVTIALELPVEGLAELRGEARRSSWAAYRAAREATGAGWEVAETASTFQAEGIEDTFDVCHNAACDEEAPPGLKLLGVYLLHGTARSGAGALRSLIWSADLLIELLFRASDNVVLAPTAVEGDVDLHAAAPGSISLPEVASQGSLSPPVLGARARVAVEGPQLSFVPRLQPAIHPVAEGGRAAATLGDLVRVALGTSARMPGQVEGVREAATAESGSSSPHGGKAGQVGETARTGSHLQAAPPGGLAPLALVTGLALALFLYSRLRRASLGEQATRAAILARVQAAPGGTAEGISKTLALHHTTARYHLRRLRDAGLVSARLFRARTYYFPPGSEPASASASIALRCPAARRLSAAVASRPGIAMAELCRLTATKKGTAHHHARRLADAGLVTFRRDGRAWRLFPAGW